VCKHVEDYTKSLDKLAQSALVWMVLRVIATLGFAATFRASSLFPAMDDLKFARRYIVSTRDYGKTLDANREKLA
jgi:hypothetical protein